MLLVRRYMYIQSGKPDCLVEPRSNKIPIIPWFAPEFGEQGAINLIVKQRQLELKANFYIRSYQCQNRRLWQYHAPFT